MFAIEVEAGDLIRVPRGTHHWFDLCGDRRIRAIRLFQDPSGWTPHYTDSGIDRDFQPVCFGPAYFGVTIRRRRSVRVSAPRGAIVLDIEGTTTPIAFVYTCCSRTRGVRCPRISTRIATTRTARADCASRRGLAEDVARGEGRRLA